MTKPPEQMTWAELCEAHDKLCEELGMDFDESSQVPPETQEFLTESSPFSEWLEQYGELREWVRRLEGVEIEDSDEDEDDDSEDEDEDEDGEDQDQDDGFQPSPSPSSSKSQPRISDDPLDLFATLEAAARGAPGRYTYERR